jgi:hypothetical protein
LRAIVPFLLFVATQVACVSSPPHAPHPAAGGVPEAGPIPGTATADDLRLGDEVRATVGTFPPFVGTVLAIQGNTLRLRTDRGEVPLRLTSIRILEVRRYRRTRAVEGGVIGAVLGAVLGRVTLIGLSGEHWESQGRILAPGLGAIAGGLLGALLGSRMRGDYWETIPVPEPIAPERTPGLIPPGVPPASNPTCAPEGV